MQKAKLFWTGRSQAVRLPKEFRFEGDEVRIRREGQAVVLEPIATDWVGWRRSPAPSARISWPVVASNLSRRSVRASTNS